MSRGFLLSLLLLGAIYSCFGFAPPVRSLGMHGDKFRSGAASQQRARLSQMRMLAMPASSYLDLEEKAKRLGVSPEKLPLFMFDMAEERAKAAAAEAAAAAAAAEALAEEKAKAAAALAEEKTKVAEERAKAAAALAAAEEKAKAAAALAAAEEKANAAAALAAAEEKANAALAAAEEKAKANATENYLKLCLASVQQRFYLEKFFREALKVLQKKLPKDGRIQVEFPSMSIINDRVQKHWPHVRSKLSMESTLQWPETPGRTVLYGQLSEQVHNTGMWKLLVGSKTPKDLVDLWKVLAKRYDVEMEKVDEESAASGEIEVNQYSQDSQDPSA